MGPLRSAAIWCLVAVVGTLDAQAQADHHSRAVVSDLQVAKSLA